MDPNTALEYIRRAAAEITRLMDAEETDFAEVAVKGEVLADHFTALDEWLTRGGFKPSDWA